MPWYTYPVARLGVGAPQKAAVDYGKAMIFHDITVYEGGGWGYTGGGLLSTKNTD